MTLYNESIERGQGGTDVTDKDTLALELDVGQDKSVYELLNWAQDEALVTLDVSELFT